MKDYFEVDASRLKSKKLWLFDMDGTLYAEEKLFDGALDLLNAITINGGKYIFITNNSSKSVIDYLNKVTRLGIEADDSNFFTSAQALILLLHEKYYDKKIYCQGTKSLVNELRTSGLNVTENIESVDVVIIGFDTELTSEKVYKTCNILMTQNVDYYATNLDLRCPVEFGFIPDCGSICQMIENATGKRPTYIGKPEPTMAELIMKKYGVSNGDAVVVGDRLYTDIAIGLNANIDAVCVLTGEATVDEICDGDIKPTYTFNSVKEIYEAIK